MMKKQHTGLVFLIFLNGFISMGFMSLGYFLGTRGDFDVTRIRKMLCAGFLTISVMAIIAASFPIISGCFSIMYAAGIKSGVVQTFIFSLIFLSVGPFLFGFNTTLLSRMLHKYNTNYAGNIMAWDTIGSVIASIATTLLLMPFLGVNNTVTLVVMLSLVAAFITMPRVPVAIAAISICGVAALVNSDNLQQRRFGIIVNNANSTISVTDGDDVRVLYMNGLPMSVYFPGAHMSAEYINYINDNFIYNMPRDKQRKILVLGAGGFTAGLRDDFNDYTFVDIEPTLKGISEQRFLDGPLTPNKKFIVRDASQYLKNTPEKYDLIILDVYSNSYQIPENLITVEFMERIKSRVADGGAIIMNMVTSASFRDAYTRVFDNTFHHVFPHNTQRQVIGPANPWITEDEISNVMYIYYNRENDGRIYTINKTPVIYDRYK